MKNFHVSLFVIIRRKHYLHIWWQKSPRQPISPGVCNHTNVYTCKIKHMARLIHRKIVYLVIQEFYFWGITFWSLEVYRWKIQQDHPIGLLLLLLKKILYIFGLMWQWIQPEIKKYIDLGSFFFFDNVGKILW